MRNSVLSEYCFLKMGSAFSDITIGDCPCGAPSVGSCSFHSGVHRI